MLLVPAGLVNCVVSGDRIKVCGVSVGRLEKRIAEHTQAPVCSALAWLS